VVRSGSASWVIPSFAKEVNAKALHVISPDVVTLQRQSQKVAVAALQDMGVEILEWQRCLCPTAPWEDDKSRLPKFFGDYCALANNLAVAKPEGSFRGMLSKRTKPASYKNPPFHAERFVPPPNILEEDNPALAKYLGLDDSKSLFVQNTESVFQEIAALAPPSTLVVENPTIPSDGVPSLVDFIALSDAVTPPAVLTARANNPDCVTSEQYQQLITEFFTTEPKSRTLLSKYVQDAISNKYFLASDAGNMGVENANPQSLYAAAMARLVRQGGGFEEGKTSK